MGGQRRRLRNQYCVIIRNRTVQWLTATNGSAYGTPAIAVPRRWPYSVTYGTPAIAVPKR